MYHCKHYDQRPGTQADGTCLTCKNVSVATHFSNGEVELVCPHTKELMAQEGEKHEPVQ